MDNDDIQVGRVLSRREALALLGAAGASVFFGCTPTAESAGIQGASLPACVVRPEQTEGPYFLDAMLNRSDIRSDPSDDSVREGVPLHLVFNVSRVGNNSCTPLPGVMVDVWQCDALGVYSGFRDRSGLFATQEQRFLRGYQMTDERGTARFTTIYPGWYPGRAVHIHFKIRTDAAAQRGYEFTSQVYFDEALTDRVHALPPYAEKGQDRVRNERDGLFRNGGTQLMLHVTENDGVYTGTFDVGLELA
jgi:protocatechuate 3,4-dioxygenase beta subunit